MTKLLTADRIFVIASLIAIAGLSVGNYDGLWMLSGLFFFSMLWEL